MNMNSILYRLQLHAMAFAMASVLSGCLGGGAGTAATGASGTAGLTSPVTTVPEPAPVTTAPVSLADANITGYAVKGPVSGASVTVYTLNTDGTRGTVVAGPYLTGADGSWSGIIPAGSVGPFLVVATGGSYIDEAQGAGSTPVALGTAELLSLLPEAPAIGPVSAAITPYTHAVVLAVEQMAAGGTDIVTAVTQAIASAQAAYGLDPLSVIPPDPLNMPAAAGSLEKQYAGFLGGLSLLSHDPAIASAMPGASPFDIALAIASDMADGILDGLDLAGNPIPVRDGAGQAVNLPALGQTGLEPLVLSIWTYMSNDFNFTGVSLPNLSGTLYTEPVPGSGNTGGGTGGNTGGGTGGNTGGNTGGGTGGNVGGGETGGGESEYEGGGDD